MATEKPVDAGKLQSDKGMNPTPEYVGNYHGDPVAAGELTPAEAERLRQQGQR
jgi:hypothetical protein